jgi:hypothetical protein
MRHSQVASIDSQVEKLPQGVHSILRPFDSVTGSSWIIVDFVVVASLETLVPKEMDSLVVDARQALRRVCFSLHVSQTVCLVPAVRENVE